MLETTTKTVNGEARPAVRWGQEGTAYACAPDGDCGSAVEKALAWAGENGATPEDIETARAGWTGQGAPPARPVVNITPGSEERAARLRESRRRFTAP